MLTSLSQVYQYVIGNIFFVLFILTQVNTMVPLLKDTLEMIPSLFFRDKSRQTSRSANAFDFAFLIKSAELFGRRGVPLGGGVNFAEGSRSGSLAASGDAVQIRSR